MHDYPEAADLYRIAEAAAARCASWGERDDATQDAALELIERVSAGEVHSLDEWRAIADGAVAAGRQAATAALGGDTVWLGIHEENDAARSVWDDLETEAEKEHRYSQEEALRSVLNRMDDETLAHLLVSRYGLFGTTPVSAEQIARLYGWSISKVERKLRVARAIVETTLSSEVDTK
jgi:hypothetical protein